MAIKRIFRKNIITLKEFLYSIPRYVKCRFVKANTLGYLDPQIAEKIRLEIAKINDCKYCFHAHEIVAEFIGVEGDEIKNIKQPKKIDKNSKEWLVLDFSRIYVNKLNEKPSFDSLEGALAKLKTKFTDNQIEKIKTIVYVMNFNNRAMNTIELLILRLGGKVELQEKRSMLGIMILIALLSVIAVPRVFRLEMMNLRNKIKTRRRNRLK